MGAPKLKKVYAQLEVESNSKYRMDTTIQNQQDKIILTVPRIIILPIHF